MTLKTLYKIMFFMQLFNFMLCATVRMYGFAAIALLLAIYNFHMTRGQDR